MIFTVNNAECLITSRYIINTNPKRHDIRKLFKRRILLLHFAPNGIGGFFTSGNGCFNAVVNHILFQSFNNLRNNIASLFTQKIQTCNNGIMCFFIKFGKSDFFKFVFNFLHTDTLGKRRINIKCFFGNTCPFIFGTIVKRTHVM